MTQSNSSVLHNVAKTDQESPKTTGGSHPLSQKTPITEPYTAPPTQHSTKNPSGNKGYGSSPRKKRPIYKTSVSHVKSPIKTSPRYMRSKASIRRAFYNAVTIESTKGANEENKHKDGMFMHCYEHTCVTCMCLFSRLGFHRIPGVSN